MRIIMVMVASLDGKITKGHDPDIYTWTSLADQNFFFNFLSRHNLAVMGSKTYAAVKSRLDFKAKRLRIVLTKHPQKYRQQTIPGKLEFTGETPIALVKRLAGQGFKTMVLAGGGSVNYSFLKARLVSELYLVVEPLIFGLGKPLVAESPLNASLKLIGQKRLNKKGTLLLRYKIQK